MQTAHMQLWFPQYPQLLFISGAAPPQVSVRPRPVRLLPCVRPGKSIECCPFAMSVCVAPISACQRSVFDIRCARRSCVLASSVRVIRAMVLEYAARGAGFAKNLLLCVTVTTLVLGASGQETGRGDGASAGNDPQASMPTGSGPRPDAANLPGGRS